MKTASNDVYTFKDRDLVVVTLDKVFADVQVQALNDLHRYGVESFNTEARRVLLHHLILQTSERILGVSSKMRHRILLITPSFTTKHYELYDYFEPKSVHAFVLQTFKRLKKHLPYAVYMTDDTVDLTLSEKTGEMIELLNCLTKAVETFDAKDPNLRKIKRFSDKNGLKFLEQEYFAKHVPAKLLPRKP